MAKRETSSRRQRSVSSEPNPETGTSAVSTEIAKLLTALKIEQRRIDEVRINPRNARTHTDRQITQVAGSIAEFGFLVPILIDETGMLLAGHGRLEAAKLIGLTTIPTIVASHLTAVQKRAFVIADNRLAELAGWDKAILKLEFEELFEIDHHFDFEITGFVFSEIDAFTGAAPTDGPDPDDLVDPIQNIGPAVTSLGDTWLVGDHKISCGNCLDAGIWSSLLGQEVAGLIFTDPPYNVRIDGYVSGLGKVKHREFEMASGEMSPAAFERFLDRVIGNMVAFSRDGAIHYICMDWKHQLELLKAALPHYSEYKNLCVWAKTNAGMGAFYRSQHELVHVFKVGTAPHINNFKLGEKGRYRTNIWPYPGVNTFKANRDEELNLHPTVKPVAMVADALLDCSNLGDIVVDPFGGSGTTLMAAERTHRRARLIEIDPIYVDTTIRRWMKRSGESAELAETGESFQAVAERRLKEGLQLAQNDNAKRQVKVPRRRQINR